MKSCGWIAILVFLAAAAPGRAQTIGEYQRQAVELVRSHRFDDAIAMLDRGLLDHPDDPELMVQLGRLLARRGSTIRAKKLLERVLQLRPGDAQVLKSLAEVEVYLGNLEASVELYRKSLAAYPADSEAHYQLAFALYVQGDLKSSLEAARLATEGEVADASYRRLYASLLDQAGRKQEADKQWEVAARLAPRDPEVLATVAERHRQEKRYDEAVTALQSAIDADAENPRFHQQLARVFALQGRADLAEAENARASQLTEAFDRYIEAVNLAARRRRPEAILRLEPVVSRVGEFVTGAMFLAHLYREQGLDEKALQLYMRMMDRTPLATDAVESGAWIHMQRGSLEAALNLYEKLRPRSPNQALALGYRALLREDWSAALEQFRKVEALVPLNPQLLELIAFGLRGQRRYGEAVVVLQKASRLAPHQPRYRDQIRDARVEEAASLLEKKLWKQALDAFTALLSQDGLKASYFFQIAYCRQQLGQLEQAVRDYRAGLAEEPQTQWVRVNLATCLVRLARYAEAARQWEAILAAHATAQAYQQLGLCYSHLNRYPEAERAFENALRAGKENGELLYLLGVTRQRLNRPHEGWDLIRRSAQAGYAPARKLLAQAARARK